MGLESDSAEQRQFQLPLLLLLGQWINPFITVAAVGNPGTCQEEDY